MTLGRQCIFHCLLTKRFVSGFTRPYVSLAGIPEEAIWLASRKSRRTRRPESWDFHMNRGFDSLKEFCKVSNISLLSFVSANGGSRIYTVG